MEYHLHHGEELQKNLFLKGSGTRSSPRAKSMQRVMELDGRQYPEIDDDGYRLPQDLHQSNPP